MLQASLFDAPSETVIDRAAVGKSVIKQLQAARRAMSEKEKHHFDYVLKNTIRRIKLESSMADDQAREVVLDRIEHCSHTAEEIADDLMISEGKAAEILKQLAALDLIRLIKGYRIGERFKPSIFVSQRKPCSCAERYTRKAMAAGNFASG